MSLETSLGIANDGKALEERAESDGCRDLASLRKPVPSSHEQLVSDRSENRELPQ